MGAGASSGAGPASSAVRMAPGPGSVNASEKITGASGSMGPSSTSDQAYRASGGSVDYASPKHAKHVVIQAADPKANTHKGQKGGLMDKLRQIASQNNSPSHSAAGSRMASRTASQAGSHLASEKSQMSTRISRRDDYDVDSDDEDLEGFIYDDESTSEDEREDYVNAFSRRKKLPRGDDYSDYEGAAVRALTAGRQAPKSAAMRRSQSNTDDDDGDDEWDPEEEKIRVLRQQKRQQERAKAAALSTRATNTAGRDGGVAGSRQAGAGSSTAAAVPKGHDTLLGQQQQARMTPQPPTGPPTRGSSGNVRRPAVASGAAPGSCGEGGGAGALPGPGSGRGPGLGTVPAAASRLRTAAPPPPQVNYGASAASQYWQAKRNENDDPDGDGSGGQGLSRLEQLMALQKKKHTQQERRRSDDEDHNGGVRWQMQTETSQVASQPRTIEREGSRVRSERDLQQMDRQMPERTSVKLDVQQERQDERAAYSQSSTPTTTLPRSPSPPQSQQQQSSVETLPRSVLDGHSFIKHLAPPSEQGVLQVGSGRVRSGGRSVAAPSSQSVPQHAPMPRGSEVTDFDVDEMLNSFGGPGAETQQQQWAGGRPQPPTTTPPSHEYSAAAAPQHKRSIRNVQSDFVSMRVNDVADGTDLTARMLSLPLAASRPAQNGTVAVTSGQAAPAAATTAGPAAAGPTTAGPPTAVAAAGAMSRFARMGANMLGPSTSLDGSAVGAPAAAWGGAGVGVNRGPPMPLSPVAAQVPTPFGLAIAGSPVRRPRRSNQSSDGGISPIMHTSLSAPAGDGSSSGATSGGGAGGPLANQMRPSLLAGGSSPRLSGSGAGDSTLVLPAIRPGSGGNRTSEGGGILSSAPAANVLGRSRFGNSQHQKFQQEAVRASAPTVPTQRDYDSDSALTRTGGPVRSSWNGGNGIAMAGSLVSGPGLAVGAGPSVGMGPGGLGPASRSRLAQVGA